jgi:DNA-binding FadR family transcriptional regulator
VTNPEPLFEPLKNKRTFDEISSRIKGLIFEGALKPGDKLPSETVLSKQFDVGRQTVREALRLLEVSGFITIQKGGRGGPVVKDTILTRIGELFSDAFRLKKISLGELTSARLEIERVVLKHVIENIDQEHLKLLKDNVQRARANIDNNAVATKENFEFHSILSQASKNHVFVIVMESIMALHADLLSQVGSGLDTSARVVSDHERILEAIEQKDTAAAFAVCKEHVLEVDGRLRHSKPPSDE